jgi:hypothetical protein
LGLEHESTNFLLKKLIAAHVVKKLSAFYRNRRFVTAFARTHHWAYVTFLNVFVKPPPCPKLEDHTLSAQNMKIIKYGKLERAKKSRIFSECPTDA